MFSVIEQENGNARTARLLEKSVRRVGNNSRMKMLTRRTAGHRHIIIDAQCDTKTIKTGTEIGSARRNANGYLLHR